MKVEKLRGKLRWSGIYTKDYFRLSSEQ